jgi:prepilin-type processing-associated H-X9-DG protein
MLNPAASALLAKPVAAPASISISENLDFLDLTTAEGETVRLPAARLRAACKCAHCIRARIDGVFDASFDGIAVTNAAPIGDYAINIAFSDGHARGIYPWSLLLGLNAA